MKHKKSGELTIEKLGVYIIAGLTIAVLMYVFLIQGEGGLQKLGGNVEGLKKYAPDFTKHLEAEELPSTQTSLPQEHLGAIRSLKNTINSTLLAGKVGDKDNCFAEYGKLPNLGERQTSIEFRKEGSGTMMMVYGGVDGRTVIPEFTTEFENMVPCVIAGSDEVAENFFTKFIEGEEVSGSYFQPVDYVKIFYTETLEFPRLCTAGNRIMSRVGEDTTSYFDQGPNYHCNNLQDSGIFFSPDHQHICFIPTNYAENADQHGIEQGFVGGTKSGSIRLQLEKGEFKGGATQC